MLFPDITEIVKAPYFKSAIAQNIHDLIEGKSPENFADYLRANQCLRPDLLTEIEFGALSQVTNQSRMDWRLPFKANMEVGDHKNNRTYKAKGHVNIMCLEPSDRTVQIEHVEHVIEALEES
jgi:hypothetical protein